MWLTFRARDNAISPAVLISFSLRSKRSSLGLSATASAKATAPVQRLKHEKIYTKENHYEQGSAKFLILHLKKIVMTYQCWYIKIACQYFNPKNQCECIYKYINFLSSFASFSLFNYIHIYKINTQSPSLQTIHCTWCNHTWVFDLYLPSQVILVPWRPSLSRDLLPNRPSFNRCIPSFVILLCPMFSVSRLCVLLYND